MTPSDPFCGVLSLPLCSCGSCCQVSSSDLLELQDLVLVMNSHEWHCLHRAAVSSSSNVEAAVQAATAFTTCFGDSCCFGADAVVVVSEGGLVVTMVVVVVMVHMVSARPVMVKEVRWVAAAANMTGRVRREVGLKFESKAQ